MVSIDAHLGAIKSEPLSWLDSPRILELCREHNYFPEADGKLDPPNLLGLFMQQIAAGNVACEAVRMMGLAAGRDFSAGGYCQARMRMPLQVIETIAREVGGQLSAAVDDQEAYRWRSHRVLLMDATSFSMPDEPELQAHFGQPGQQKPGCGFPVAHVLMLFNARTGMAVDALTAPLRTHEASLASTMHDRLSKGDLVVGDDSFGTYALLASLNQRGARGLFPLHHKRIADFTPGRAFTEDSEKQMPRSRWIKSLGKDDQLVEWFKPEQKPKWMSLEAWKQVPESMLVRELRRTTTRPGFRPTTLTVATTLLDPVAYPADDVMALRIRRWDVETDLLYLKTIMGMDVLRCKTVDGVKKELWIFLLIYNLVRRVMIAAAQRQQVPVSRISFSSALHWLRHARVGDTLPNLKLVPYRPNRMEPRVIKRRPKQYDIMTKPRDELKKKLRQEIGESAEAIAT
jgi:DDE family transposase